jgi:tetratricopeptide (TPR) repeat protein
VLADALSRKNSKANKLYDDKKYEEALKVYRDAQIEAPESAELHYNIGTTLYRKKKFDEGLKELEKSLSSQDAVTQQKTYYNMGNCHYRAGDDMIKMGQQEGVERLKQSIEAYKKALELDPNDQDAKFNIEFVQNKLKELAQNSPQDKNKQKQQQQQQQNQKQQQQQKDQEQKQDQQQQQQQQDAQEQEGQQQPQLKKAEMSEEDAKRILDALKDEEKDLQKKLRRIPGKPGRVVKDW